MITKVKFRAEKMDYYNGYCSDNENLCGFFFLYEYGETDKTFI